MLRGELASSEDSKCLHYKQKKKNNVGTIYISSILLLSLLLIITHLFYISLAPLKVLWCLQTNITTEQKARFKYKKIYNKQCKNKMNNQVKAILK